jgi:hypothetical protein
MRQRASPKTGHVYCGRKWTFLKWVDTAHASVGFSPGARISMSGDDDGNPVGVALSLAVEELKKGYERLRKRL